MTKNCLYLFVLIFLLACHPKKEAQEEQTLWEIEKVPTPAPLQSGEGNIAVSPNGDIYLSWISHLDSSFALQYAAYNGKKWSDTYTIAQGKDWFVNWADFPTMAIREDGSMAAHWLEKSSGDTYDYDIKVSQSMDGKQWEPSFTLHQDSIPAEHGFVSMQAANQQIMAVWLDGRNTKKEGGAMTLRAGMFDAQGSRGEGSFALIDGRICDCCQTDLAMTPNGAVAVYRNRSAGEIRDIYISRYHNGQWTEGKPVFEDRWLINGCPVNGPAVDASGINVAVAWFAAPNNKKRVQVAFSTDEGHTFPQVILLDSANVLGRVDIAWINPAEIAVSWMSMQEGKAVVKLAKVGIDGKVKGVQEVIYIKADRSSGFPILAKTKNALYLSYRQIEPSPQVQLLRFKL